MGTTVCVRSPALSGTLIWPAHLPCTVRHDFIPHDTFDIDFSWSCRRYKMIHDRSKLHMLPVYA